MQQSPRVFVSATTRDLASYRKVVADVLWDHGIVADTMEGFDLDYGSVSQMLNTHIMSCEAVICLIGHSYGAEPRDRPEGAPRRSYTQIEYDMAQSLGRPVYRFVATDDCRPDSAIEEPAELRQLQGAHRRRMLDSDQIHYWFTTKEELARLVHRFAPVPSRVLPRRPLWNLPASIRADFKGRKKFLSTLWRDVAPSLSSGTVAGRVQVIHGLPGVGKTRVAIEYGWKHTSDYKALLHVPARTPQQLRQGLASLAETLQLDLTHVPEEEKRLSAVLAWLEICPGWFLIVDNVDTEAAAKEVERTLARLQQGHVIITSQLPSWGAGVEPRALPVLGSRAAEAFLRDRTLQRRRTPADGADVKELAKELDRLPIALEWAAQFVNENRCSLADYLTLWRRKQERLLEWHRTHYDRYSGTADTTFETALDQVGPETLALLRMLSWMDPSPVPISIFRSRAASTALGGAANDLDEGLRESRFLEDAISGLYKYSLAERIEGPDGEDRIAVHPLIQRFTLHKMPTAERRKWLESLGRVLAEAVSRDPGPGDILSRPVWESLSPHVATAASHAEGEGMNEMAALAFDMLGMFHAGRGCFQEAEDLLQHAIGLRLQIYGDRHGATAESRANLAQVLCQLGRFNEAETSLRESLDVLQEARGASDLSLATCLDNLGWLLRVTNRASEARRHHRRAWVIRRQALPHDHPEVAVSLVHLAGLLHETRHFWRAQVLCRRALAIRETALGPDHPETAISYDQLAGLLRETGRTEEAEVLYRRALDALERSSEIAAPSVALVSDHLAVLLAGLGRFEEAGDLFSRALDINRRAFGPDHWRVGVSLEHWAAFLCQIDRLSEAEPLLRRAIAILEATYGPEHPEVAVGLFDLAGQLWVTGRQEEARALFHRADEIWNLSFEPSHPDVLFSRAMIESVLGESSGARGISTGSGSSGESIAQSGGASP